MVDRNFGRTQERRPWPWALKPGGDRSDTVWRVDTRCCVRVLFSPILVTGCDLRRGSSEVEGPRAWSVRRNDMDPVGLNPWVARDASPGDVAAEFLLPSRVAALGTLRRGVAARCGPVLITGEPGVGKTWLWN